MPDETSPSRDNPHHLDIQRGSFFALSAEPYLKSAAPIELLPVDLDHHPGYGTRGKQRPFGVAWFGFRSFWGPLYHLVASAIATADIDSRDWMCADPPWELAERIAAQILGHVPPTAADGAGERSLAELLDRDVWVDFLADSGDDISVSEAVGRLFASSYRLPDPDPRGGPALVVAGRGDLLVHGGDIAYPVATDAVIHERFVVPFNKALAAARDGRRRVILGVPGNHDWYDGLDGFGRLMRRRAGGLAREEDAATVEPGGKSQIVRAVRWVERFVVAGQTQKIRALVLDGYVPVQEASYFLLPIAKDLDLWGLDRQLRSLDFRQRQHFHRFRQGHPEHRRIVLFPDPVYAHLEPSKTGFEMVEALGLDLEQTPHLCLAGDLHHYERRKVGASLHVTAGGGGAFLHGARLHRGDRKAPAVEWPSAKATAALLRHVPLHMMLGRAGFIPHVLLLLLYAPAIGIGMLASSRMHHAPVHIATMAVSLLIGVASAWLGSHQMRHRKVVFALSGVFGLWLGLVPILVSVLFEQVVRHIGMHTGPWLGVAMLLFIAVFSGTFAIGAFLVALSSLGLEHTQAMTALAHPGFRHFVRMRIRRDGSRVDAWVIGLEDPVAKGAQPKLVDRWSWKSRPKRAKAKRT